jgi:hypothetical protein
MAVYDSKKSGKPKKEKEESKVIDVVKPQEEEETI